MVTERKLRRALLATPPPDEIGAQRRAWRVVRAAYGEREPTPWPIRHRRPLAAAAIGAAVLAAAITPPGRAVIDEVREAVGTEKVVGVPQAKPALFSLPTQGRVLVSAPTGAWVVSADGSRRKLGDYDEATWSPRGLFVGVSKRHQLAAVTPKGVVRWTLSKPRVHAPRWSPSGFRVAYLSGSNLRLVAGDGTGDRRLDAAQNVPPVWKPGEEHVLAYADRNGTINVVSTDDGETLWTAAGLASSPMQLEWSADATRLLAMRRLPAGRFALVVFDEGGRRRQYLELPGEPVEAAFAPNDHRIALVRRVGPRSELLVVESDTLRRQEVVFSGLGRFSDVAWSPGARWFLLGWQSADQWLFIRSTDVSKVSAVSSLAVQFDPGGTGLGPFPRIEGWCCPQ
jgi:dipeptidyl aminopeptidase/acylaminoacyl peptidase